MSQMVLPQASPQGPQADSGSKSVSGSREKNGESPFDSVSRAEQQRIDRKQAEKRDQARVEDDARSEKAGLNNPESAGSGDLEESSADTQARNVDAQGNDDPQGKGVPSNPSAIIERNQEI